MERLVYDAASRKRGMAAVWSAVLGYLLFAFFLLAGFGDMLWMPYALAAMTAVMLLLFAYGFVQMRTGAGSVELSPEGIRTIRGRKSRYLQWSQIGRVWFSGVFHAVVKLQGGGTTLTIYKVLPGYPQLWQRLARLPAMPALSGKEVTVRCRWTPHSGLWLSVLALLAVAAGVIASLALSAAMKVPVLALFAVVAVLCLWALVKDSCRYTFTLDGIRRDALFRKTTYRAMDVQSVTVEQIPLKLLITGYRYRGEAMTRAVRYSAKGLCLQLRIGLAEGELVLDETRTRFPLELLHKELCLWYGVDGRIVTPDATTVGSQA